MKNLIKGGLLLGLLTFGAYSAKADTDIYIVDTSYQIGVVDLTTDTVSLIGNSKTPLHDIAFTANGNFYGVTQTALYSLSTTTGAASLISNFPSGFGGNNIDALVGDGNNLLAASFQTKNIYAVDVTPTFSTSTLASIPPGLNPGAPSAGDIVFGPAGNSGPLYDALSNGYLDKITISGTTITAVSQVGYMGNTKISGLATVGGTTYAIAGTEVYVLDLTSAALTPVFNYGGLSALGTVAGAAAPTSLVVPEPSNVALLLSGVCALAYFQARKRVRA